jgi:hypothetical protein
MQVSWLSLKTEVNGLSVVWPQNHSDDFLQFDHKTSDDGFLRFGLKIGGSSFPIWASKRQLRFGDLSIKITTTVS